MKKITISAIKWSAEFDDVNGSYYDRMAEIYSPSESKEKEIIKELTFKGWRKIETDNGIVVFEKDRHIIRIYSVWK